MTTIELDPTAAAMAGTTADTVPHLGPERWATANRHLVRKALAEFLHERILAFLARENKPELADIRVVYGPGDFDQAMPRYVTAFLASRFATQPLRAAR